MDIEAMITQARAIRDQKTRERIEEQGRNADSLASDLQTRFCAVFGDELFASLGARATCAIDQPARIVFRYRETDYSLRRGFGERSHEWFLTRRDPRAEGDDRPFPQVSFDATARTHTTEQASLELLLALGDLHDEPETPPILRSLASPAQAPRVMNEFEADLLDALRRFLQSEI